MIPSSKRLSTKQFNIVIEKGKTVNSPAFLLRITNNNKDTRISAVAPKKVAKTAVKRNATRRAIYNAIRPMLTSLKSNSHTIIFAKQELLVLNPKEIPLEMKKVFVKAGILV